MAFTVLILLLYQECPEYVREMIRKTRTLTDKPFGIGVVLAFPHEENLKVILEEKVAVLQLYWGEVSEELVRQARDAGVKVVPQVCGDDLGSLASLCLDHNASYFTWITYLHVSALPLECASL